MALLSALRPPSTRNATLKHRLRKSRLPNGVNANQEEEADHSYITPSKHTPKPLQILRGSVSPGGPLQPFRLVRQDLRNLRRRYISDWTLFNQLVFAGAVNTFFTNLLPGITFASDLYVLTGRNWGTIEVVFSTGLCGVVFSLLVHLFILLLHASIVT